MVYMRLFGKKYTLHEIFCSVSISNVSVKRLLWALRGKRLTSGARTSGTGIHGTAIRIAQLKNKCWGGK